MQSTYSRPRLGGSTATIVSALILVVGLVLYGNYRVFSNLRHDAALQRDLDASLECMARHPGCSVEVSAKSGQRVSELSAEARYSLAQDFSRVGCAVRRVQRLTVLCRAGGARKNLPTHLLEGSLETLTKAGADFESRLCSRRGRECRQAKFDPLIGELFSAEFKFLAALPHEDHVANRRLICGWGGGLTESVPRSGAVCLIVERDSVIGLIVRRAALNMAGELRW